MTGLTDDEIDK